MIAWPGPLDLRRAEVDGSADLAAMRARLGADLEPFLDRPLYLPERKALLSRWGGLCRDCRADLDFDPWSPDAQRCTGCGRVWSTEQSQRWWVYWYQLWFAERVLLCALLPRLGGDPRGTAQAAHALQAVVERYLSWPNADNVLGPSRPFFSTYLESIWVLHLATAATLLDRVGALDRTLAADLTARVFRPSAELIADFDEGRSNRQTWNAAALFALGFVLADEGMRNAAANGPSGILATIDAGLAADGLWYEGENYHWFALRGLAWGVELVYMNGGVNLWKEASPRGAKWRAAFAAPVLTALPDFTFPARRDSKFGVTLRQRRCAELWELALARVGPPPPLGDPSGNGRAARDPRAALDDWSFLSSLLAHVYDAGPPERDDASRDSTEVERGGPPAGVRRGALGWKGLLWALPALPAAPADGWRPGSVHLEATGLAVVRRDAGATYVSLDYGDSGGGHGHPDRLHLTLVQRGRPWLLDFGTGSYVTPSLQWYRSSLAHNAPFVDGASQAPATGRCVAYADRGDAAWVCAQLPEHTAFDGATLQRTVVVMPDYVLDVVQLGSSTGERELALPWHGLGEVAADEDGLTFAARDAGPPARLRVLLTGRQPFQVQIAEGYGPPVRAGDPERMRYAIVVASGEEVTLAACITSSDEVLELECLDEQFIVRRSGDRFDAHSATDEGWRIERERGDPIELGGVREPDHAAPAEAPRTVPHTERLFSPLAGAPQTDAPAAAARCLRVQTPPALDGTMDGFRADAPLALDRAEQFRRAEEPWEGAERFGATAWLNHDEETLYVAVDVTAPDPAFRAGDAPNPELDNENPDINGDGLQLYVATTFFYGWVVVPDVEDPARLRATPVPGTDAERDMVRGAWSPTAHGYRVTLALALPDVLEGFGFDLLVNRGRAGRERRVGQLVWSGARGERLYLAGDRPMRGDLPWVAVQ